MQLSSTRETAARLMDYPTLASDFGTSNPFWFLPNAYPWLCLALQEYAKTPCLKCSENDSSALSANLKNQTWLSCHLHGRRLQKLQADVHRALTDTLLPAPWGLLPEQLCAAT